MSRRPASAQMSCARCIFAYYIPKDHWHSTHYSLWCRRFPPAAPSRSDIYSNPTPVRKDDFCHEFREQRPARKV